MEAQEKAERDHASNLAAAVRKERQRTKEERQRAEQAEWERDAERQRAENAEREAQRAHRLAARLRELGVDPESIV